MGNKLTNITNLRNRFTKIQTRSYQTQIKANKHTISIKSKLTSTNNWITNTKGTKRVKIAYKQKSSQIRKSNV